MACKDKMDGYKKKKPLPTPPKPPKPGKPPIPPKPPRIAPKKK